MIPYGKQDISKEDIEAVLSVLKSDFLTQGPKVPEFEEKLRSQVGAKYAVALNSATSALHVACLALGVGPGDWVWTSPITFVASANCALYCGAQVDFVDVDRDSYNLSIEALEEKLIHAKKTRTLPKVIVPVHLCGQSCDMKGISVLAKEYGFSVIEDASHAIGGSYDDHPVGSCKYSDLTVFSFHPVKIITTAEGGVVATNNKKLANTIKSLRGHGITKDVEKMNKQPDGEWYYEQLSLGFNYRMTDIQAALGLSQLDRLNQFIERRHVIAKKYTLALKSLPIKLPYQIKDSYSSYHLYPILLNLEDSPICRNELFSRLRKAGIGVNIHYIPVYHQPYYKGLGVKYKSLENAEYYYERAISIPIFYRLTDVKQNFIIEQLIQNLS